MNASDRTSRGQRRIAWVFAILVFGVAIRAVYVLAGAGDDCSLPRGDPDGYARIGHELVTHGQYARDETGPTAFRSPGYVLAIAPFCSDYLPDPTPILVLQLLASAAAIWGTWMLAVEMGAGRWAYLAAGVVALDPALVHHSSLVMSEALFTAFFTLGLAFFMRSIHSCSRWTLLATGVCVGLAALTRPVMGPAWLCVGVASWLASWREGRTHREDQNRLRQCHVDEGARGRGGQRESKGGGEFQRPVWTWLVATVVALVVYAPWPLRNWVTMESLILTTTHGGYTLWLGMNPVYYQEVVVGPNSIWPEESFQGWTRQNAELTSAMSEVETDRYFQASAWNWMRSNPLAAVRSVCHHVASFWMPMPNVGSRWQRWLAAAFYIGLYISAAIGFVRGRAWRWPRSILLASIVAFTLVHAVYWSNVRMRAPLAPVLGVLASLAWIRDWDAGARGYSGKRIADAR